MRITLFGATFFLFAMAANAVVRWEGNARVAMGIGSGVRAMGGGTSGPVMSQSARNQGGALVGIEPRRGREGRSGCREMGRSMEYRSPTVAERDELSS